MTKIRRETTISPLKLVDKPVLLLKLPQNLDQPAKTAVALESELKVK